MSFKKLNLNRELIESVMADNLAKLEPPVSKGNNEVHFRGETSNGENVLVIFFYNSDGTTTISPRGKNIELSKELAAAVADTCLYSDKKSISLFITLEAYDFDNIIDYLLSECNAQEIENRDITGGKQIKLSGSSGDQLVLKYFTRRRRFQVQGKPLSLYEDLISILCEILPYESFVSFQLADIKVDIEPSVIKGELESRLPQSYSFLGEKVQAIISPSLALNKLNIDLEDYTAIAMPALRGLEGYLKKLFYAKGITVEKNFGEVINGNGGQPCVINNKRLIINCACTVAAIEKSYAYWFQNRHGLFHVDGSVETTRVLTQNEAKEIIEYSLKLIEETYTAIPK